MELHNLKSGAISYEQFEQILSQPQMIEGEQVKRKILGA
jgi:hypothetical protein